MTMQTTFDDGQLTITFQYADGTTGEFSADLLLVRIACEQCEARHDLALDNGSPVPTAEYLSDLAGSLAELGGTRLTPSLAYRLWILSAERMTDLKKNMLEQRKSPPGTDLTPAA